MGFLSGLGRMFGPGFGDRAAIAQAMLAGDYGGAASIRANQQRIAAAQAEAEREQQMRAAQMEAAAALGFSKPEIAATNSNDLSAAARDRMQMRQFGAEGGSLYDPRSGTFNRAPARYMDQGRMIDVPSNGAPQEIYDARANDINWQIIPNVGAFATDRTNRPTAPGANLTSPLFPGASGAPQPQAPANIPSGSPLDPNLGQQPPQASESDVDRIFSRMIQQESGGRQFGANGQPLASRAGAIGVAQVMPGTAPEAARLAGLPYDEQRYRTDPQYNMALGRAYFQEQLRTFGDPVLAAAAYNAGPQRIANAVQRHGENWHTAIPRETQDYVRAVFGGNDRGPMLAQAGAPNMPGRGRSLQDQAATGQIMAPPDEPAAQTPWQARRDRAQAITAERELTRTPGQEALDREYAERYAEWRTGGFADAQRNLEQLQTAINDVRNYNVSGGLLGRLPDFMVNDRVVDTREQIEEVVQRNLRVVLGAQFTEREGERLISRAYNPRLDESVNARRLERLYRQIGQAAQAQESAARYFEQHGTLRGWRGRLWRMGDFNPERPDPNENRRQPQQPQRPAPRGRTQQGVRWRRVGQ